VDLKQADPKNTFGKAYSMPDLTVEECRTVFLEWVISIEGENSASYVTAVLEEFSPAYPTHPLTQLLQAALQGRAVSKRRNRSQRET